MRKEREFSLEEEDKYFEEVKARQPRDDQFLEGWVRLHFVSQLQVM